MASLNKATLIGRLGADPEIRYTPDGTATCRLSLATTEKWKGNDGEKKESTEWHRVTLFRRLAEIAGEYLAKGSLVYIEGTLRTRKWTDSAGVERYRTEIVALSMQMLSSRNATSNSSNNNNNNNNNSQPGQDDGPPDFDDDIPF